MSQREGFGLVFAGGGGKGAYEIGVWKALLERRYIKIGAVSGTSVGALNAALFAVGDYENAEDIWLHITQDKILTSDEYKIDKCLRKWAAMLKELHLVEDWVLYTLGTSLLIKRFLNNRGGMFSRQGLKKIIQKTEIAEKMYSVKIPCYATCYNLREKRTQYFQLNDLSKKNMETVLLASSAIPFVFPKEKIGNASYYDGGLPLFGDNVPVKPLYDAGWRRFIVVHLEREEIEEASKKYKKCQFIHIFPKNYQGGIFDGTLDFSPESAKKRLDQGYWDMKQQIDMMNYTDADLNRRDKAAEKIYADSKEYKKSMSEFSGLYERDRIIVGKAQDSGTGFQVADFNDEYDKICKELSKNRARMNDFVLKGVAANSAAMAQLDEKYRKGFFKNLFRDFTGGNKRLQHGIDKHQIDSQQAVLKMISKLVQSDAISVELIHTLQCELYGTTSEMAKTIRLQGKEIREMTSDFHKISKEYNRLVYQNKKIVEDIDQLYSLIMDNSRKMDITVKDINDEIDKMKDIQRLQNWRLNLKFCQFSGIEYRDLETIEKVICVVSDFFYLTKGVWNDELLLFIKSGLDELDVEPYELMSCGAVIYKLVIDKKYKEYLFDRNGISYVFSGQEEEMVTPSEALIQGVYIADKLTDIQDDITIHQIEGYLADKKISNEAYLSAFDIACMLLVVLAKYHECADSGKHPAAYREIEKKALLGDIDAIQKYTQVLLENNYIEEAYNNMLILDGVVTDDERFWALREKISDKCIKNNGMVLF